MTDNIKLGQAVNYFGAKGKSKLAFVVGTPETVEAGTSLPVLEQGEAHLAVFTYQVGTFTPRLGVPTKQVRFEQVEALKAKIAELDPTGFEADQLAAELEGATGQNGEPVGYFEPVA